MTIEELQDAALTVRSALEGEPKAMADGFRLAAKLLDLDHPSWWQRLIPGWRKRWTKRNVAAALAISKDSR